MGVLDELRQAVATIAEKVGTSIVGVGNGWGFGSGVVVAKGEVLTNAHNLRGDEVTVTFSDGRTERGSVAGSDLDADLAVVKVDTGAAGSVEWSDGSSQTGEPVFGAANPGGRGLRVTFGLVSGTSKSFRGPRGRKISGSVEHTAPLSRGSSGGALVDASGRLAGINTSRLGDGFYLAIPADSDLKDRLEKLRRGEVSEPVRLGVGVAPAHVARRLRRAVGLEERDGVLVRVVEEGSPADGAGIRRGDLIVEAGGEPVADVDDLHDALAAVSKGSTLEVKLVRGSEELGLRVSL